MSDNQLEDVGMYLSRVDKPRVYIGCSLTSPDAKGLRERLLEEAERAFTMVGFEVYNPSRHTKPGSPHHSTEVAAIDHLQAMSCDLIFFIRVQASLGMGLEAQIAADMLIPWSAARIAEDFNKVTPLVAGLPNYFSGLSLCIDSANPDEFASTLDEQLSSNRLHELVAKVRQHMDAAREIIGEMRFGRHIRRQRLLLNMPASELGELVDLESRWIESIERDPRVIPCLTFMQLLRMVDALRLRFVAPKGSAHLLRFPLIQPIDTFHQNLLAAADEFTDYSLEEKLPGVPAREDDDQMLAHWRKWISTKGLSLPARTNKAVTPVRRLRGCVTMPLSNLSAADERLRNKVIEKLRHCFKRIDADSLELNLPEFQQTARQENCPEIYLKNVARVHKCDFGIALATPPATGVGITTRLFTNSTIQYVEIAEAGQNVSRVFCGMYGRRVGEMIKNCSRTTGGKHGRSDNVSR